MKTLKKFSMPLLVAAIGSASAYAQQQPTEDDVNPQNRNPVSSQQGDQSHDTHQTGQSGAAQRGGAQLDDESARQSSVLSIGGAGMAFEQLARTRPDQLEGKAVIAESGKELGEVDKIVTKSSDDALYAVINGDGEGKSAIKLSQMEIHALAYAGTAEELQEQAYDQNEFEMLGMAEQAGSSTGQRQLGQEGAANSNSETSSRSRSAATSNTAVSDADQPLVTSLALTSPAHLEGKMLTGEDGEDLGQIEHIVRSKMDDDYYAVISDSQNLNQAVVKLEELEVAKLSYMGQESDMEMDFEESDYQQVSQN